MAGQGRRAAGQDDARGLDDRPPGEPLTDPNRRDDGFLLPIGGYKGPALALMFGLLPAR